MHHHQLDTNHVKLEHFLEILTKDTDKTTEYNSLQRETVESCSDTDKSQVWTYLDS